MPNFRLKIHILALLLIASVTLLLLPACSDTKTEDLYFIGDSIVARWDLDEYFPGFTTHNLGIGGTGVSYIQSLKGTQHGRIVVILTGTNNLIFLEDNETSIKNYADVYMNAIINLDAYHIYLYSVLPRDLDHEPNRLPIIEGFNKEIYQLCKSYPQITYLNVYDQFLKNGHLDYELFSDRLHLSSAGYEILTQTLLENLK